MSVQKGGFSMNTRRCPLHCIGKTLTHFGTRIEIDLFCGLRRISACSFRVIVLQWWSPPKTVEGER